MIVGIVEAPVSMLSLTGGCDKWSPVCQRHDRLDYPDVTTRTMSVIVGATKSLIN